MSTSCFSVISRYNDHREISSSFMCSSLQTFKTRLNIFVRENLLPSLHSQCTFVVLGHFSQKLNSVLAYPVTQVFLVASHVVVC